MKPKESDILINLAKLPPVHRIPRKPRNSTEVRDRMRSFSTISNPQIEAAHKARFAEEAGASELLRKRSTLSKARPTGNDAAPALVSNVQGLTRLVPKLSAQELKRLADTIKKRRLQLLRPSSPKPREELQPHLVKP